jgi:hypothetical protein
MKRLLIVLLLTACSTYGEVKGPRGQGCGMRQAMIMQVKNYIDYQLRMGEYILSNYQDSKDMENVAGMRKHKNALASHYKAFQENIDSYENVAEMHAHVQKMRQFVQKLQLEMRMAYKR